MERLRLSGRVVAGLRQGAAFTQLDWAREQFISELGIDPYPGTLNLTLESQADLKAWRGLKTTGGCLVVPSDSRWCSARCHPVRVAGRLPGAIVFPEVPGYPETQVEIIAALPLRERLSLKDGDRLSLEISRPLRVRAVIFDVDGTLVDSLQAYCIVAERAAAPYGLPVTGEAVRQALNGGQPLWEMILPADQPDRPDLIQRMKQEAVRLWPEVLREHGRVVPGLRETLAALHARGARLGIVTGSREDVVQPLREAGLMDFFKVMISAREVERRKPDPEGLLQCAAALDVAPSQAVYVGDTPIDIRASQAAGMAAVAVLSGAGDSALLSAAGPDRIIHSHARLPEILDILRSSR